MLVHLNWWFPTSYIYKGENIVWYQSRWYFVISIHVSSIGDHTFLVGPRSYVVVWTPNLACWVVAIILCLINVQNGSLIVLGWTIWTQNCSHDVQWTFRLSNHSSLIYFTTNKSSYSQICPETIRSLRSHLLHLKWVHFVSKVPKDSLSTQVKSLTPQMSPLALKCVLELSITQVRFDFTQMNAFSFKFALCTLQSLKWDFFNLKLHSIYSHKPFHTQGTQTTLPSTQNTFNGFKQAFQH